jgi:hypothetical protein
MPPDHEGNLATVPDQLAPDTAPDSGAGPAGWGAALAAKLDLQIGRIDAGTDAVVSELQKLRREARLEPANVPIPPAVFTYQSGQPFVSQNGGTGIGVLLGGPEIGREWSVRQILVGGTTLTATPTGVAWILISPQPPNELSITSVADFTKEALPQNSFYGEREIYVPPNSNLWVVITGGTNGTQYVCMATVQEQAFAPRSTEISG